MRAQQEEEEADEEWPPSSGAEEAFYHGALRVLEMSPGLQITPTEGWQLLKSDGDAKEKIAAAFAFWEGVKPAARKKEEFRKSW